MSLIINSSLATAEITTKDSTADSTFIDVIGNKTDTAAVTSDVVSIVGLIRYIIANMDSDTDVATLIGALNTAAATGAVGTGTTIMGYVKQLITDERALNVLVTAIKAVTDVLPNAGALTSLAQDGTVAKASVLGAAVGATISADIAAVKTATDGNGTKLGTIVNTGGTAALGSLLGDFANVTLVSRVGTLTTELAKVPKSDSTVTFNATALASVNAEVDTALNTIVPASPTGGSINDILSKATGGNTFDKATDSLEAISDSLAVVYANTPRIVNVQTVSAGSTVWTQVAHRLFTVTGTVLARVFGVVTTTLVGAGTLGVGVAGATNGLIATVADATTLATGDILANSGTATLIPLGQTNEYAVISDTDVDVIVGTANVTAGRITFYCQWIPVSTGATVVANTWD